MLCAAVCALATGGGAPAHAHTALLSATPSPGSKVGPGTEVVSLKFGQLLGGTVPSVSLTGPNGRTVPLGEPVVAPGATVCAAVKGLPVGVNTLTYEVLAADGDVQTNRFYFEVKKNAAVPATPSACAGRELPEPANPSPSPVAAQARDEAGGFLDRDGVAVTGVAAGVAVAAGLFAVRRKRRGAGSAE